jgi:hypothetical protein
MTPAMPPRLLDIPNQIGECPDIPPIHPQLPGIGTALPIHGGSFKPDQPEPTLGITSVPPQGQFPGNSTRSGITAFHGLNTKPVWNRHPPDHKGVCKHRHIVAHRNRQIQTPSFTLELIRSLQMKRFKDGVLH